MPDQYKEKIFSIYCKYDLGKSQICQNCKKEHELKEPVPIWHVGDQYGKDTHRIMFVGKTAIGDTSWIEEKVAPLRYVHGYPDVTDGAKTLYFNRLREHRAFWNYTRAITEEIYGDDGWNQIVISNLIKCNSGSSRDATTMKMKQNCLQAQGFAWEEIKTLRPTHLIFYTNYYYDDFIDKFRFTENHEDVRDSKFKDPDLGGLWWHRKFFNSDGICELDMLRVPHPQGKTKKVFVEKIVHWIQRKSPLHIA